MNTIKVLDADLGANHALYNGDCIEVIQGLPDDSVDLTVTSIPFSDQYTYSASDHDLGNNAGDEGFFKHFEALLPELLRVTVPGRLCCIHVKDRLRYKNKWGSGGLNPFSDMTTAAMLKHGWNFHARITIATDPVRELQQTKRQGLRYMDIKQDGSMCGPGMPEYLMIYRKWSGLPDDRSFSAKPVVHDPNEYSLRRWQLEANACWQSDGGVLAMPPYNHEERVAWLQQGYDYKAPSNGDAWIKAPFMGGKYAGPKVLTDSPYVWPDVERMKTLNGAVAKEDKDSKHICPLQLDLIERAIRLWSNPGDVVFDPFAGIGSTPYQAVKMGRAGVGIELKQSYFKYAAKYVNEAEAGKDAATLFDAVVEEV